MEFPCVDRVRRVCREGNVVQSLRQEAARLFQELWFLVLCLWSRGCCVESSRTLRSGYTGFDGSRGTFREWSLWISWSHSSGTQYRWLKIICMNFRSRCWAREESRTVGVWGMGWNSRRWRRHSGKPGKNDFRLHKCKKLRLVCWNNQPHSVSLLKAAARWEVLARWACMVLAQYTGCRNEPMLAVR